MHAYMLELKHRQLCVNYTDRYNMGFETGWRDEFASLQLNNAIASLRKYSLTFSERDINLTGSHMQSDDAHNTAAGAVTASATCDNAPLS